MTSSCGSTAASSPSSERSTEQQQQEETMLIDIERQCADMHTNATPYGATITTDQCEQEHLNFGGAPCGLPTLVSQEALALEEEEMHMPWPATFERSVQLLAKPIASPALVKFASESMHVLPPTRLKKNTSLSDLNRGWRTPDPTASKLTARVDRENNDDDDEEGEGVFARMGLKKIPTLDWRVGRPADLDTEKALEEKQNKALEYFKMLREQRQETDSTKQAEDAQKLSDKATVQQCIFNMANMLMGIGILSLPFVFKTSGWLGGSVSLLIYGIITWWTSVLLGRELNGDPRPRSLFADDSKTQPPRLRKSINSFPAIAREAFGQSGAILLSAVLYLELFSSLAIFLVSVGDHLHSLFPVVSKAQHMTTVALILTIPTTLCKTPRLLSYLSAVGTCTTITVVLSVLGAAIWEGNIADEMAEEKRDMMLLTPPYHTALIVSGLPVGLGLVAFCFSGHAIVPSVYTSMEKPQRFESMIGWSFFIVIACCLTVAASGYYMFGSTVSDQITISLEQAPIDAEIAMTVLSWLMITTLFTKFCLYQFPLALAIQEIVAPCASDDNMLEWCFAGIKIFLTTSTLVVAIYTPGFAFLTCIVGLICSVTVSVVFPAAAHLKLFGRQHLPLWEVVVDWFLVIGGSTFAIVGTIASISSYE